MQKRRKHLFLCLFPLLAGLCVYVFCKPSSHLHLLVESIIGVSFGQWLRCDFLNYYLCDFLWGFSLTHGLLFILGGTQRTKYLCIGITTAYGILWEVLQYCSIVSGTGDFADGVIYLLASILAAII